MAKFDPSTIAADLAQIISQGKSLLAKSRTGDRSDIPSSDIYRIITLGRAAIERITGTSSPYSKQVKDILDRPERDALKMQKTVGVVEALKADVEAGRLATLEELVHGELFADFVEMAAYLLEEGYKDPAAVVVGASLEAHLRQLCKKYGIDTNITSASGSRPKKADQMNADLAKAQAYNMVDHKNVTAWLDLRNKAAHGAYNEYTKDQVALMVAGVRDFIARNPA